MLRAQHGEQRRAIRVFITLIAVITPSLLSAPAASALVGDGTPFPIPSSAAKPVDIAAAPNGSLWLALQEGTTLATVATRTGAVTTQPATGLDTGLEPGGIVVAPDGRVWFTNVTGNSVASVSAQATDLKTFALPKVASAPGAITVGPDGALWFTEVTGNRIGRITTAGAITEFDLPDGSEPRDIVTGPDKNLWVTLAGKNSIARITTAGVIQTYPLPTADSRPHGIAVGSDGNLWFTESGANRIGRISTSGALAEFTVPTASSVPLAIAAGPDGAVWFTELQGRKVGRIDMAGMIAEYWLPTGPTEPVALTAGADGNMWIVEQGANRITRLLTGVVPQPAKAPAIEGASSNIGATVKSNTGEWLYEPTTYRYQWQRCTTGEASSCADIAGATKPELIVTAELASSWLRSQVVAANLNGEAAKANQSALLKTGAKPIPAAVTAGVRAAISPTVNATLRAVNRTKRGKLRKFRVTFNAADVRGTVRLSLVNIYGTEVKVITKGVWVTPNGPNASIGARWWRVTKKLPPGAYSIRAVFTPATDLASTYAAATLTRSILLR